MFPTLAKPTQSAYRAEHRMSGAHAGATRASGSEKAQLGASGTEKAQLGNRTGARLARFRY
eukprot:1942266-Prymnesium_polylepis.1